MKSYVSENLAQLFPFDPGIAKISVNGCKFVTINKINYKDKGLASQISELLWSDAELLTQSNPLSAKPAVCRRTALFQLYAFPRNSPPYQAQSRS